MKTSRLIFLLQFFFLSFLLYQAPSAFGALEVGFYSSSCPTAESIIQQVVQQRFNRDKSLTAAMVRLHFHDCFVKGCDASILIDHDRKGSNRWTEKAASDSSSLRGFDVIDEIKEKVEVACPSTVSCADIIAVAARDVVVLGGGPKYEVPTGRRDGLVSNIDDVDLPQPEFSVTFALEFFQDKGLTLGDMVTLLGAHTVGVAHCHSFHERLGRFPNETAPPPMDPALRARLAKLCSSASKSEPSAFLDQDTSFVFDNSFYRQILRNRGVLQLDQQLALHNSTMRLVSKYAKDNDAFLQGFAKSIVRMGSVQVLTGHHGEIRKNCRLFNDPN